jgi:hypothetical protein
MLLAAPVLSDAPAWPVVCVVRDLNFDAFVQSCRLLDDKVTKALERPGSPDRVDSLAIKTHFADEAPVKTE